MKFLSILVAASILVGSTAFHHKTPAGKKSAHAGNRRGGIVIATVVNNSSASMSGSLILYNTVTNQTYVRRDFTLPEGADYDQFPPSPYFGTNVNLRVSWNFAHTITPPMGYFADISFLPGQTQCESINLSGSRTYATAIDGGTFTFNFYTDPQCQ